MDLLFATDLVRTSAPLHDFWSPRNLPSDVCSLIPVITTISTWTPGLMSRSLLKRKAIRLRRETGDSRYVARMEKLDRSVLQTVLHSCYRPFELLILEPMVLNLCMFSAILLGILYLFFGAFPLIYERVYGWSLWQVGCSFLGLFVGMIGAVLTDPIWRRNYRQLVKNHQQLVGEKGEYMPEWRLPPGKHPSSPQVFVPVKAGNNMICCVSSHCRSSFGHCGNLHLCLDNISQRPLDCAYYWQRPFRGWVRASLQKVHSESACESLTVCLERFLCIRESSLSWSMPILCMLPAPWPQIAS
jgi:hypothetical protein